MARNRRNQQEPMKGEGGPPPDPKKGSDEEDRFSLQRSLRANVISDALDPGGDGSKAEKRRRRQLGLPESRTDTVPVMVELNLFYPVGLAGARLELKLLCEKI